MPRNPAGLYSLPDPPVVGGNTILATDENVTRNDIATELSNSLDRQGRGGMLAPFKIFDGTEAVPGLGFLSDVNTGMFRDTIDVFKLGFAVNGAKVMGLAPSGMKVIGDAAGDGLRVTSKAVGSQTLFAYVSPTAAGIFDQPAAGGNGIALQTAVNRIDVNVLGAAIASVNSNGFDVNGGKYLRANAGVFVPPTSGTGIEIFYDAGGGYGAIATFDRGASAYKPMRFNGSLVQWSIAGTIKLQLDTAGLTVFNDLTVQGRTNATGPALAVGSPAYNGFIQVCRSGDGAAASTIGYTGGALTLNDSAAGNGVILQYNSIARLTVKSANTTIEQPTNTAQILWVMHTGTDPYGMVVRFPGGTFNDTAHWYFLCQDSTVNRLFIYSNGGIHNYSANNVNLSDNSIKVYSGAVDSQRDRFRSLDFVMGKYSDATGDAFPMLSAQQVQSVFPDCVTKFGDTGKLGIYEQRLWVRHLKVTQEHDAALQDLASRVFAIEEKLNA